MAIGTFFDLAPQEDITEGPYARLAERRQIGASSLFKWAKARLLPPGTVSTSKRVLSELGRKWADLVFPPRCPLTDKAVWQHGTVSAEEWGRLQLLAPPWCQACGLPFAYENRAQPLCGACAAPHRYEDNLTGRGRLDQVRSAIAYDDTVAPAILRLKYADRFDGVDAFARLMVLAGESLLTEGALLVPVPLHRGRLLKRRYNQASVLADGVAGRSGVPVDHQLLKRARATAPQRGGSRSARARNVQGAFVVAEGAALKGKSIVLVDDVLTTGATLVACAKALRKGGAERVSALALARVVKPHDPALYEMDQR